MSPSDNFTVPAFLMRDDSHVSPAMLSAGDDQQTMPDRDERHSDLADLAEPANPADLTDPAVAAGDGITFTEMAPELTTEPVAVTGMPSAPIQQQPDSPQAPPAVSGCGQSAPDLALFRRLTGYHLDAEGAMWKAVDDSGNRVSVFDRLFTTLAGEAFRYADRDRKISAVPERDLSPDDLVMTLQPIRRAAAVIGSRGVAAFERLEAAILRLADERGSPPSDLVSA